jgi:transcriptional regulator with XRE-family HTH domain
MNIHKREGGMTLKELRLRAGLLQVDVAKKLNVDQSTVSKWDNGLARPARKYRKKLAKLYGCTEDEL